MVRLTAAARIGRGRWRLVLVAAGAALALATAAGGLLGSVARGTPGDTITLQVWPAGQGRIEVTQTGRDIEPCDFTDILANESGACQRSVTSGTPVTLTAVAEPNTTIATDLNKKVPDYPTGDSTFVRWSRDDCAASTACTFTPDTDLEWITAFFSPLELEVGINNGGTTSNGDSVQVVQGGGPLTCVDGPDASFEGADRACHGLYPVDASLVLHAQPYVAGTPNTWGAGCEPDNADPGSANCTVTLSNIRTFATIAFGIGVEPPQFPFQIEPRLTVRLAGSGHGRVTGTGNIDCGSSCSADLSYQAKVTLTATAEAGSTFAGWRGVCSTNPTCVFAAGSATSISAVFDHASAPPTTTGSTTQPTTTSPPPTGTTSTTPVTKPKTALRARLAAVRTTGSGARRTLLVTLVVNHATRVNTKLLWHGQTRAHARYAVPKGKNTLRLPLGRGLKPGWYRLVLSVGSGTGKRTLTRPVRLRG